MLEIKQKLVSQFPDTIMLFPGTQAPFPDLLVSAINDKIISCAENQKQSGACYHTYVTQQIYFLSTEKKHLVGNHR